MARGIRIRGESTESQVTKEVQETMTDEQLREETIRASKTIDRNYLVLARNLSRIYHEGTYIAWNKSSFNEYIETELEFKPSKARYLVEIWDKIRLLNLPWERVEAIGWTKMGALARSEVLTDTESSEKWLQKAETTSRRDLTAEIKVVADPTLRDTRPKINFLKFRLAAHEASIVNEALDECKRVNELDDYQDSASVTQICSDWLKDHGVSSTRGSLADHLDFLSSKYGVQLLVGDAVVESPPRGPITEDIPDEPDEDDDLDDDDIASILGVKK